MKQPINDRLEIIRQLSQPVERSLASRRLLEAYAQLPIEQVKQAALQALELYGPEEIVEPAVVAAPAKKRGGPKKLATA